MIYAHIDDARNYFGLGDVFAWALRQLSRDDLKTLPAGKTDLIPGKAWYVIEEPLTKPRELVPYEAHREFIDVQTTISGDERIGFAPVSRLVPAGAYDAERDIRFFRGEGMLLDCRRGMFAVLFPEDAHQPCVALAEPSRIRKVVVKIHTSLLGRRGAS